MPDDVRRLTDLAAEIGGPDSDQVLETLKALVDAERAISETAQRTEFLDRIMPLFIRVNKWAGGGVAVAYIIDTIMILSGAIGPGDRLISAEVVLALVAATAAQLGAIAFFLAKSVFKAPS